MKNRRFRSIIGSLGIVVLSAMLVSCQAASDMNHKITVTVLEASGGPVANCSVDFEGDYAFTEVGRLTSAEGIVSAAAPDGVYQARATCEGATARESFTIEGSDVTVTITLEG